MQDPHGGGGRLLVEVQRVEEKRTRRGRMNLTQYLESQEDQDMTRLLYFTKTQERRKDGSFLSWNGGERESLYSSSEENMNRKLFNES